MVGERQRETAGFLPVGEGAIQASESGTEAKTRGGGGRPLGADQGQGTRVREVALVPGAGPGRRGWTPGVPASAASEAGGRADGTVTETPDGQRNEAGPPSKTFLFGVMGAEPTSRPRVTSRLAPGLARTGARALGGKRRPGPADT